MASDSLKREALKAWLEYGDAIVSAFHFPAGSRIAGDVASLLEKASDEQARAFLAWVRQQTEEVRGMKFVGES